MLSSEGGEPSLLAPPGAKTLPSEGGALSPLDPPWSEDAVSLGLKSPHRTLEPQYRI